MSEHETLQAKIFYFKNCVVSDSIEHERKLAIDIIDAVVARLKDAEKVLSSSRVYHYECAYEDECAECRYFRKYPDPVE